MKTLHLLQSVAPQMQQYRQIKFETYILFQNPTIKILHLKIILHITLTFFLPTPNFRQARLNCHTELMCNPTQKKQVFALLITVGVEGKFLT